MIDRRKVIEAEVRALGDFELAQATAQALGISPKAPDDRFVWGWHPTDCVNDAMAVWDALPESINEIGVAWYHERRPEVVIWCGALAAYNSHLDIAVRERDSRFGVAVCRAFLVATLLNMPLTERNP